RFGTQKDNQARLGRDDSATAQTSTYSAWTQAGARNRHACARTGRAAHAGMRDPHGSGAAPGRAVALGIGEGSVGGVCLRQATAIPAAPARLLSAPRERGRGGLGMNENASRTAAGGCEEMLAGSLASFNGFAETPSTPPA